MTRIEQDDHRFFLVMLSEAPLRAFVRFFASLQNDKYASLQNDKYMLAKPFTICVNLSYLCHLCAFSKQPDKLSFHRLLLSSKYISPFHIEYFRNRILEQPP